MGLAERRAVKSYQDTVFPGLQKQIDDTVGAPVPVEVNWKGFEDDKHSTSGGVSAWIAAPQACTEVYFLPLIAALKAIAADEMGRDALKAALKKIVIQPTSFSSKVYTFQSGVLTVGDEVVNVNNPDNNRIRTIQEMLEKAL